MMDVPQLDEKMDVSQLGEKIAEAMATAEVLSEQIRDRDVLLLIGCTGAGKTTAAVYTLGGSFKLDEVDDELSLTNKTEHLQHFEIGDSRCATTRGLNAAEMPGHAVYLCDLAGTHDTEGYEMDICACIVRAVVLRKARSVRVALVMGASTFSIQYRRGKPAVEDIVNVAGMFKEVSKHLDSIGLVLTNASRGALTELWKANKAVQDLCNASKVVDDWTRREDRGSKPDNGCMQITRSGQVLLQHVADRLKVVQEMRETIQVGDAFFLPELLKRKIPVWPLNVLEDNQRNWFRDFLVGLKPVDNPHKHMKCELPEQEKNKLETVIMEASYEVTRVICGARWAGDSECRRCVVNLLVLTTVLRDLKLFAPSSSDGLCTAGRLLKGVCDRLCATNMSAVQSGVAFAGAGNREGLSETLLAMEEMDNFRKQLQLAPVLEGKIELEGWAPCGRFLDLAAQTVRTALECQLPEGVQVRVNAEDARKVDRLLACAGLLGAAGVKVLSHFAERLSSDVDQLQRAARACASPATVTTALACLTELSQHFEEPRKRLQKSGCLQPLFQDGGLATALVVAKDGVISQLEELSKDAIRERRDQDVQGERVSANWRLLHQLCNSTELQQSLEDRVEPGEELTQKFLFVPFSEAFAPSQESIDVLVEHMRDSKYKWNQLYVELKELAHKIQGMGELGRKMVETRGLSFVDFFEQLKRLAVRDRDELVRFAQLVKDKARGQSANDECRTVISGRSDDEEEERTLHRSLDDDCETANKALERLAKLVVADDLFHVVPPGTHAPNVGGMLVAALEDLEDNLRSQLRKAGDIRDEEGHFCVNSRASLRDLMVLKVLLAAAERALESLEHLQTRPEKLAETLKNIVASASKFIHDFIKQHTEEWAESSVEQKGWMKKIHRHLQNAQRFELLDPKLVQPAKVQLRKKVASWRDACMAEAEKAKKAKTEEEWDVFISHAVSGGLAFESSPLAALWHVADEFYVMVTEAVQQWSPRAGAGASSAVLDPQAGKLLAALHDALLRLPQEARRQNNVTNLVDIVQGALAPHLAQAQTQEQQFRAALGKQNFFEAAQALQCVREPRLVRELQRGLAQHVEFLEDKLDTAAAGYLEVSDISQAKRLLKELDKISKCASDLGEEFQTDVQTCRESVQRKLDDLKTWAVTAGQESLGGRGDARVPLEFSVALTGEMRATVAQSMIDRFTTTQREAFGNQETNQLDKLMRWLRIHDKVRQQLPPDFKSNITAWDELMTLLVEKLKQEINIASLQHELDGKRWNHAKTLCASFRDTISEIKHLSIMATLSKEFEDVENNIRILGGSTAVRAQTEVPKGIFRSAIWAIVTGSHDAAMDTVALVVEEVHDNLNLGVGAGVGSVSERLRRLRAFQLEVGNDPPSFLANISRQVDITLQVELPKIEAVAQQELGKVRAAAKQEDLRGLAEALQSYETFQGCDADSWARVSETLREFWLNVKSHTSKALADVSPPLNLAALTANLVPIKQWLRTFEQLGEAHRTLLLPSLRDVALQPALGSLREWVAHLLQPAMASLVRMADELAQERQFKELSECYEISALLSEVIQQPAVDLTLVAREVQKAKDDALRALLPIPPEWSSFREAYRLLQAVDTGFPALPGARAREACQEVERKLREKVFTEQLSKTLQAVTTLPDAQDAIMKFRTIGEWVPELLRMVIEHLKEGLKQLQNNPQFNTAQAINDLGVLLNADRLGQMVCAEQSQVFSAASNIAINGYLRQSEERQKDTFVHQLTERTGLGHEENEDLRNALHLFQAEFERLKVKLLLQKDVTFPQTLALARQELDQAVLQSDMTLLTTIVACYSVVKCGEAFIGKNPKEQSDIFFRPHVGQVLALFRLLQAHQQVGGRSTWRAFADAVGRFAEKVGMSSHHQGFPSNHLVQMQTGEGKCLTLGLLATFLALKGVACDIVCYQRLLVDQDRSFMMPFYVFAGVNEMIRYMTFDDLCEERLAVLQDATREMLESGQSPPLKDRLDTRQRALLIDEVDVFFSEGFYGQIYNGAFKVMGPEAEALIRFVWEEKMNGRRVSNVTQTPHFLKLRDRYSHPELQEALACAAESLATNVNDFNTPMALPDFVNGRVGYQGVDEIDYGLAYENKTVFVYLFYLGEQKFREEQVRPHLGLDLVCGRFSFAEIPRTYLCNLGVTGTLSQLMGQAVVKKVAERTCKHPVKQILWDEYQFRHFTELPSIYGQRDANLDFKLEDHAFVLGDEKTWAEKIDAVIKEQRNRPKLGSQAENAVLVFCETAKDFDRLALEVPNFRNYERLAEDLDLDRRQELIKAATTSGRVTLVTKAFGRGIDFVMPNTHLVVVIQVFLSPLLSEEVQIMGRTARRGASGRYLLVLCAPHLQEKFGVTDDDLDKMKLSKVDTARILKERQAQTAEKKVRAMIARRQAAGDLESETREWEKLLFDPAKPVGEKLQRLARWNMEHFKQIHYTLILDCSGSMSGQRWRDLVKAFSAFLRALQENEAKGVATGTAKVSVVFFATHAQVMVPHHVRPMEVQDIGDQPFSGGTNFDAAFAQCHQVLMESTSATREAILFLTDGEGNCVPKAQIKQLLDDHGSRIETFTCIGFNVSSTSQLDQIRALFAAHGGITAHPVKNPGNEADLVQTFKDAAHSREVRHGQLARTVS